MAIRKYPMGAIERAMVGVTEWYALKLADFVINATTTHTLCNLAAGDIILPQFCVAVIKTLVVGPTATMTLGVSATVNQFIAATTVASGKALVPSGVAGNMAGPTGAQIATEMNRVLNPYIVAATDTLVAQAVVSNTPITAGEVWFGVRILRRSMLDQIIA